MSRPRVQRQSAGANDEERMCAAVGVRGWTSYSRELEF